MAQVQGAGDKVLQRSRWRALTIGPGVLNGIFRQLGMKLMKLVERDWTMKQTASYPLRLPLSLKNAVAEVSREEGTSINQFVVVALAEKLAAIRTERFFAERRAGANADAARRILFREGGQPPDPEDRLPLASKSRTDAARSVVTRVKGHSVMKDARESAERTREIVRQLPKGFVVTYGDISNRIYGNRSGGQAVAAAVEAGAREDPREFPWWRVVNADLKPTSARSEARRHLEEEKIRILQNGTVDPRHYDPVRAGIA